MTAIAFSDTTNKNGVIQICEFNCGLGDGGISNNSTLLKQFTALANTSSSEIWHAIFRNTSGWKYDDSNKTDLPQATNTMTAGVAKYALPTDALTIDRVEVKGEDGNWYIVKALTLEEIKVGVDEYLDTDGRPIRYRLVGRTVELFPAPAAANVTLTNGLKIYFGRGGVAFSSSDTSTYPGFDTEYHDILPIKMSVKWLQVNKPDSGSLIALKGDETRRVAELEEFTRMKFKDRRPSVLRAKRTSAH